MHDRGVAPDDVALARVEEIGRPVRFRGGASLIWADVLGQARSNARPVARYLVLMIVAGVIAAYGVIEVNSVLIVGAMAVSPDVLPVAAACVALIGRRRRLAGRAIVTLAIGLAAPARLRRRADREPRPARPASVGIHASTIRRPWG